MPTAPKERVNQRSIQPGPGWHHVNGAVWDHTSGLRCHLLGTARLATGEVVEGTNWPEAMRLWWFIRANGGSRRRGVLAWALSFNQPQEK